MVLLEIREISKSFGGVKALQSVSFDVESGRIIGLIGPNGAGKTTLFNIISGFDKPNEGMIRFQGEDIVGLRPDRVSLTGIARTFQLVQPFFSLSLLDNIAAGILFGRGRDKVDRSLDLARKEAHKFLEFGKLIDKADRLAGTLTLSERKRLEMVRAIATGPKLLLLDEVLAGLNPTETDEIVGMLTKAKSEFELTILLIEHNIRVTMGVSDKVVVLDHGVRIAEGKPEEIASNAEVIRAYLGEKSWQHYLKSAA